MGSSLAAMGVASSVATNLYEKKTTGKEEVEEEKLDLETIKAEIKSLVESTAPGKRRLRNYCLRMWAKRRSYCPFTEVGERDKTLE